MKKLLSIALAVVAAAATFAPQDADAKNNKWRKDWRGDQTYRHNNNNNRNWRSNNRQWNNNRRWNNGRNNGMYINNGVGSDGYPAWMGGYKPGRGR